MPAAAARPRPLLVAFGQVFKLDGDAAAAGARLHGGGHFKRLGDAKRQLRRPPRHQRRLQPVQVASLARPQKSHREPSFTFTSTSPRRSDASTAATSPSGSGSRCRGSHSPAAAALAVSERLSSAS